MRLKITPETKFILGVGSIVASLIMGFSFLDILPFEPSGIITGWTLLVLAGVIFAETWVEDRLSPSNIDVISGISLLIALTSIILGAYIIWCVIKTGFFVLPLQYKGILGFLFIIDAVVVAIELRK